MNNKYETNVDKPGIDSIQPKEAMEHIQNLVKQASESSYSLNLKTVLATRTQLRQLIEMDITFSKPILMQGEHAVIFPHTINVIQGQAGVHKSRLAECICSAMLKKTNCDNLLLNFHRTAFLPSHTVVYVDTERNLTEQLPFALQSIQMNAGYEKNDHPENFEYISLLQISRKQRFQALDEYLKHIKQKTQNPLFIVLDVTTDCIEDFNKTDKSMELIDLMNIAINEHDVTFLCLIHENPNSSKARGHIGTELMNKSSTVMQVGFEKDASQNDTDLIRVKYLKCRSTAKYIPFYIKFSTEEKRLVLADPGEIDGIQSSRKLKAPIRDVIEFIEIQLSDGSELNRRHLLDILNKEFGSKDRMMEDRIKEIIDTEAEFFSDGGILTKLTKEVKDKTVFYKLIPHESQ